jgi:ferredoxin
MPQDLVILPDKAFLKRTLRYGGADLKKCYQCATCSSACTLSGDGDEFPRKQILLAQFGMEKELLKDPGPWLCFYCGECTKLCPRKVNPGEVMMALRRYLTTRYDWTGLSRRMYDSARWEIGILALVALFVVALFTLPHNFGFGLLAQSGPAAMSTVMLERFAPVRMVHLGDTILALLLTLFVLSNAARMLVELNKGESIPVSFYVRNFGQFFIQALTQKRWRNCDDKSQWLRHFVMVSGYATIFTLVVVFLPWFQIADSHFDWTSIPGYYAAAVLLGTTLSILRDRANHSSEMHRFSHLSDWLFPILLLLTAATGILLHILRMLDLAMAVYVTYTVHMAIAVPMLVVEVPFGKWAHLLYRPLAIYVAAARKDFVGRASACPGET